MEISCRYGNDDKLILECYYGYEKYIGEAYLKFFKKTYPEFCDDLKICKKEYLDNRIVIMEPIDIVLNRDVDYKYPFKEQFTDLRRQIEYLKNELQEIKILFNYK